MVPKYNEFSIELNSKEKIDLFIRSTAFERSWIDANATIRVAEKEICERIWGNNTMNSCRRLSVFTSLLMFVSALSLVIAALISEYWFESTPINEKGGLSRNNFIHSGLLKGSRQLDWGLGPRYKPFSVAEKENTNREKIAKTAVLFKSHCDKSISVISYGCSVVIFLVQYATSIKHNVLLADQIEDGFSTLNQTSLLNSGKFVRIFQKSAKFPKAGSQKIFIKPPGQLLHSHRKQHRFAYWLTTGLTFPCCEFMRDLLVAAMCVLLVPSMLMFLTADRTRRPRIEKQIPVDSTVFMY
uniref:Uncharacterized protein n=1 Tax=Parascaris equorum TaxID=6256 RepID=A0A914R8L6_PAREQ